MVHPHLPICDRPSVQRGRRNDLRYGGGHPRGHVAHGHTPRKVREYIVYKKQSLLCFGVRVL